MNEDIIKKVKAIKRSAELLLEHYETRAFKNTLMETGLKNILGISDSILEDIEKEKKEE